MGHRSAAPDGSLPQHLQQICLPLVIIILYLRLEPATENGLQVKMCTLQERSTALEKAEKEKQKKAEQMQQAQADLARQAAMIRDLQAQAKGRKENRDTGASAAQVGMHAHTAQQ